jgi:ATP-binding cassette subfamily C protein LapB
LKSGAKPLSIDLAGSGTTGAAPAPAPAPAPKKVTLTLAPQASANPSLKPRARPPVSITPANAQAQPASAAATPPARSDDDAIRTMIEGTAQRIKHRATLISTFAALNGVETPVSDIAEHMWLNAPGDVSIKALANALALTGITPRIAGRAKLKPETWPALTMMQNGQCVLVIGQAGDTLTIFDTTCPDNRAEVPVAEFESVFSGTVLTGRATLKQIAERHIPTLSAEHWFWGEFPKYRRQIAEIMAGSLVANVLAVAVALFSLQVYDRVIPHQSEATLWVLAAGVFLAIALEATLKLARARLTDAAGRQIELSLQRTLMQRLIGMRSDQKPLPPSGLIASMRDFGSVREFFTSSTIATLADVPFIAIFLLLVASIAGNLVWVIVAGGILMLLPAYFMQKRMIALNRQSQGANTRMGRLLHEVVTELDTLKTQRAEERTLRLWDELNALASHSSAEQRRLSGMLTFWSQGVQQATYIIAVIFGTYLVFAGEFTVGTIIATGILTSRTLAPLTQFAGTLARWGNVKTALEALDAVALAPQEKDTDRSYLRREALTGHFELRDVEFRYDDDGAPTLDIPGIAIMPGQRVAILGANGSGKSTLLKLLSGLYTPTKGRVLIDGTEMTQIDPRDLRRGVGFLGQEVRLMAGTLRDNLNLNMLERDDDRLMAALDFAGLGPFVRGHHKGLDLEIRDGGDGLSVGQRQSIGWAQLWLQDPATVLLDEPTAAMDQGLERTLVSRLEAWLQGRTAIIATHRKPILSLTDRTLILQAGRMVVDGPRDQVLAHLAAGAPE